MDARTTATLALAALFLATAACSSTEPEAEPTVPTATAVPTATVAPTDTPATTDTPPPTRTPAPTDTPAPPPEPVTLSGTGDSVIDVDAWACAPSLVHIVGNEAGRHFAVENYDAAGERLGLLANTTDPYDGTRPLDWADGECTTRFQMTATGDWSITLLPLADIPEVMAHATGVPGTYVGDGDDVVLLIGGEPDLAVVSGNEAGHHFAVIAWAERGELLVNTVDPYRGTVMLDATTLALEVVAAGPWTVEVTGK